MKLFELLNINTADTGNWMLEFNEHKTSYMTVEQEIETFEFYNFVSEEDKQKCIDTNTLYLLHWYKNTPVGSFKLAGSSLEIVESQVQDILNA